VKLLPVLALVLSSLAVSASHVMESGLPSWRFADTTLSGDQVKSLRGIRTFELNSGVALSDEEASGMKRERFEKCWQESFAGFNMKLGDFGKTSKQEGPTAYLTTTLWTQPARSDADVVILLDTSIDRPSSGDDIVIWRLRDMWTTLRKGAAVEIKQHIEAYTRKLASLRQ